MTLAEINQDIILQVAILNRQLNKLKKLKGIIKYKGFDVISSLSIFEQKEISNIIICFDDLERKSKNIDMKDILGLISDLKEQKKCQIIVINNKDQLSESDDLSGYEFFKDVQQTKDNSIKRSKEFHLRISRDNDIYQTYSEKIFDHHLYYDPTIEENFNLVKHSLNKSFGSKCILELLYDDRIADKQKNIRLMKKLIDKLNIFSFLEKKMSENIERAIVLHIFKEVYKINDKFLLFDIANIEPLISIIDESLKQSKCSVQDIFNKAVNEISNKSDLLIIHREVDDLDLRHLYDLSYSVNEYHHDLKALLYKNIDKIFPAIGFGKLFTYIELLKSQCNDEQDRLDELLIEATKKGIDQLFDNIIKYPSIMEEDYFRPIARSHKKIEQYLDQKKTEYRKRILHDDQKIIEKMKEIRISRGWNPSDDDILSKISVADHKKYIKFNRAYFEELHAFTMSIGLKSSGSFSNLVNNFTQALKELAEEDKDNQIKLQELIDTLDFDGFKERRKLNKDM